MQYAGWSASTPTNSAFNILELEISNQSSSFRSFKCVSLFFICLFLSCLHLYVQIGEGGGRGGEGREGREVGSPRRSS